MKKRLLSLLLSISMLATLFSVSVYAKAPGVETMSATDIEEASAVLRGKVTSNSGIKIMEYGFQYGSSGSSLLSYEKFYKGRDFDYPDPINNDIIECELTNLKADTEYHFEFYAINENNEKTVGRSMYFTTEGDDEEPEITKFKSSEGKTFHEGVEVTFTATATDNNEVDNIAIYIDGVLVARKYDSTVKYTTDELEPDEYELAAIAEDAAGNESDVEYLTITVLEEICIHNYYEDYYDYTQYEQISGDNNYHNAVHYYERVCDDCDETIKSNIKGDIQKESHSFSGNKCTKCSYENVEEKVEKDTEDPEVYSFYSSTGNTVNRDEVETITFTAYAKDNNKVSEIELNYEGTPIDSEYGSSITSTVQTSALNIGKHEFYVIAEDEAGNYSYSDSIYITITENEDSFYGTPQQNQGETSADGSWEDNIEKLHNKAYNNASYYGGIKVYVDGKKVNFDVQPQLINNRTMVPLRAIFEALGADVYWDDELQQVSAQNENHAVELVIGESTMNVWHLDFSGPSGWTYLDSPAILIYGRTLVPVRAISEAFNCDVEWFEDKEVVSIVSND